jgi:hypothetical protein
MVRGTHGKTERWLFSYIQKVFPSAENGRLMCLKNRVLELDIYIDELPLSVEYDGLHHRKRVKKDENKNYLLRQHGISLIRIREHGLPSIKAFGSSTIIHYPHSPGDLHRCLLELRSEVETRFALTEDQRSRLRTWGEYVGDSSDNGGSTVQ